MVRLSRVLMGADPAWEATHSRTVIWHCPGCGHDHQVPVGDPKAPGKWYWDGKVDAPTIKPSVRHQTQAMANGVPIEVNGKPKMDTWCHYNITNGQITFHGDSQHSLAGKTVPMVDYPENSA